MPELPEVETMRRGLAETVSGRRVAAVRVLSRPTFALPQAVIDTAVVGRRITGVARRGKVLIVDLDHDSHLLIHPRMTGQLVVRRRGLAFAGGHPSPGLLGPMPNPTTRLIIDLSAQTNLFFNDARKFGRVWLVPDRAMATEPFLSRLGPEPLSEEFTAQVLGARLARHSRAPIKAVLLDQTTVAGIGNIYADETLHLAGLHPARATGTLTLVEIERLHRAIVTTLRSAVEHGGTSFADQVNQVRGYDTFLVKARVFRRQGQPCPACGTPIRRIKLAGRGTNFCPHCQSGA